MVPATPATEPGAVVVPTGARENLVAFMAVNADPGEVYGKFRVLQLPRSVQINGPSQVQNAFSSNDEVATEINILERGASDVVYGNLLRFLVFGEGEIAPVTREVLRQADEPDLDHRAGRAIHDLAVMSRADHGHVVPAAAGRLAARALKDGGHREIDLGRHAGLCVQFRADSYACGDGTADRFFARAGPGGRHSQLSHSLGSRV